MTGLDAERVKRANPIAAVVERHGVELRRAGRHLAGRCPFHEDRSPSLAVYPESARFHCFGCGASGDVIDFVRRASGLGFREALERLGGGGAPREGAPAPGPGPARSDPPRDPRPALSLDDRLLLSAACELYHETLLESQEGMRYLEGRGIAPWLARRRRLGLSDGRRLVPYLKRRRLSLRRAGELGLLGRSGAETMSGRVVIPDLRGSHCGWMVGRALASGREPRYRGLSLPRPLLGYEPGRRRLLVTEGPFDWLTLSGWGLDACALLGTQPGRGALRLLRRARSVVLVMDADEAGRRARGGALGGAGGARPGARSPRGGAGRERAGDAPGGARDLLPAAARGRGSGCRAGCLM